MSLKTVQGKREFLDKQLLLATVMLEALGDLFIVIRETANEIEADLKVARERRRKPHRPVTVRLAN